MTTCTRILHLLGLCLLLTLAAPAAHVYAGATIIVNNVDPDGVGFNDPTPADPVGGNPGTTLGEQRLNIFQFAADVWGSVLDSDADIVIQATFTPLPCNAAAAVLGSAATITIFANFPNAAVTDAWHHAALANAIAGQDLSPGPPDPGLLVEPFNDDIVSFFNSAIDNNPDCLPGNWYYGLDHNPPAGDTDLLNVVMHEYAHGLGFANFINESSGEGAQGIGDIYSAFTFDTTAGKTWNEMTPAERQASAINTGNVVWNGPSVTANAPAFLANRSVVEINMPAGIAGIYAGQAASFGPPLTVQGVTGDVILADDATDERADACEPLVNDLTGALALVDRGACTFAQKVFNAQTAGAIGVIVANNQPTGLPPMGGESPDVTIPSIGISMTDGDLIKANLPGVNATLGQSADLLLGADDSGLVQIYSPNPVQGGSSLSHWTTSATPNLLMEPFISDDLISSLTQDLTPYLFQDEGWRLADDDGDTLPNIEDLCPASNASATVQIGTCDSGVSNDQILLGCNLGDLVDLCEQLSSTPGDFVQCVLRLGNDLREEGALDFYSRARLLSCAAQASNP